LQPFWMKNYKNTAEALMVRRNQGQSDFREKWDKNSQFFKKSEVESAQVADWTSKQSYQRSMNAVGEMYRKSTKQLELEKRRNKLAELISNETVALEREMREKRLSKAGNLIEMRDRADELKENREERRKQVAQERLYEHWKENEPELRKVWSDQLQRNAIEGWGEQISERETISRTARNEEDRLDHIMELERLRALEREKEKKYERKKDEEELQSQLQKQMKALRLKEEEAEMLKKEEEQLIKRKMQIDAAEDRRKKFDKQRKRQEYGRVLVRQYKAQLRRKSQQIQEALELDLQILEDLARQEIDESAVKTSRREKAKADAEEMRKVVAEQLRLEKAREAELDAMYQEEAARQWQKRESEWERERLARERLMHEVLGERQKQVDNKMQALLLKKEESIIEREALIKHMEDRKRELELEQEDEENRKRDREREISEQITARTHRLHETRLREEEDFAKQRREEEAYKDLLDREAVAMTAREYTPRSFHRRKFAFQ